MVRSPLTGAHIPGSGTLCVRLEMAHNKPLILIGKVLTRWSGGATYINRAYTSTRIYLTCHEPVAIFSPRPLACGCNLCEFVGLRVSSSPKFLRYVSAGSLGIVKTLVNSTTTLRGRYMPQTEAVAKSSPFSDDRERVQRELIELIDRDLARRHISVADPRPRARVGTVLPDILPITGNVLIPLGRTISRFGVFLRLLKPGL